MVSMINNKTISYTLEDLKIQWTQGMWLGAGVTLLTILIWFNYWR